MSLRKRLLLAAIFTLIAFLGLAGIALDRSFINSAEVAVKNQMKTHVNFLLNALEINKYGMLVLPVKLIDPRLTPPNSGLYAVILNQHNDILWQSPSSLGLALANLQTTATGTETFYQLDDVLESPFFYSLGIGWVIDDQHEIGITVAMIDESLNYAEIIQSYRKGLVFWLGMAGLLLLCVLVSLLNWSLRPLGQVIRELDLIEHAGQKNIMGTYPDEIVQLSSRINLFINNERKNLERYRNTLDDLAHSLKTPLAVIRGMTERTRKIDRDLLCEQVEQMDEIVEYQLKKAASTQLSSIHLAVDVATLLKKLDLALQKAYTDKGVSTEWKLCHGSTFYGDESDLYELLGNIADNAYKFSNGRVLYRTSIIHSGKIVHTGLILEVHDDGSGICEDDRIQVLKRGVRAEQRIPGQGIGLAVVCEIVERYGGEIHIMKSDLGGALVRVVFPVK